jgi:hypothetical protein
MGSAQRLPAAPASPIVVVDSVRPISAVRALVSTNVIVRIDYISYLGVK